MRLSRGLLWMALMGASACSMGETQGLRLQRAVHGFNEDLRWKRFDGAAAYLEPKEQAAFLERYLRAEDNLYIESLEVRAVAAEAEGDTEVARVTVVAQSYVLPSIDVQKTIMVQTWKLRDGSWRLVDMSQHLVPEARKSEAQP